VWNERWSVGNIVLIGDALRTAHYSIGSGTRLAIEDALALTKALEAESGNIVAALARYEATRRPVVEKLVAASKMSDFLLCYYPPQLCSFSRSRRATESLDYLQTCRN
jgi:2-polyprenyl-6-methoxyphenol hydroxylase-like FAD-dependent oxidoreductase